MKAACYPAFALMFLSYNSCSQDAEALKWLAGTWMIDTHQGYIVERWESINDSTLRGESFFVKHNADTVRQESLELTRRKGEWSYIPTVWGQNNDQPVRFTLICLQGTEFISENPAHDFPQRITYRRIGDQLYASIEGRKNGRYSKRNFDFALK